METIQNATNLEKLDIDSIWAHYVIRYSKYSKQAASEQPLREITNALKNRGPQEKTQILSNIAREIKRNVMKQSYEIAAMFRDMQHHYYINVLEG